MKDRSIDLLTASLQLTYEGLKRSPISPEELSSPGLQLTYEGLKPDRFGFAGDFNACLQLTYEGLKHIRTDVYKRQLMRKVIDGKVYDSFNPSQVSYERCIDCGVLPT